MLDYAANAVVYWPVEAIRSRFEANHEDPEQVIASFLESIDSDGEEFWQKVKTNLQAGKVRLVFVAEHRLMQPPPTATAGLAPRAGSSIRRRRPRLCLLRLSRSASPPRR